MTVFSGQTEYGNAASFVSSAGKKYPASPQNRRRMSAARQFHFPIDIGLRNFGGNGFCLADSGAIWPAKPRPLLAGGTEFAKCQRPHGEKIELQSFHINELLFFRHPIGK